MSDRLYIGGRVNNDHAQPCRCWWHPVTIHDGGCCFAYPNHDYSPSKPLPCGHDPSRQEPHARPTNP